MLLFKHHSKILFQGFLVVLHILFHPSECSLNDSKTLLKSLLADYDKNVRPVSDINVPLNVTVFTSLKSIQTFDELREIFVYTAAFRLIWYDAEMVWNSSDYGLVNEVWVSTDQVWIPHMILTTPSDEADTFAKSWQMVKYNQHGRAELAVGGLIQSTCSIDIGKYPFDKQVCKSDFQAWNYDQDKVRFLTKYSELDLKLYSENVAWSIEGTSIRTTTVNDWSQLEIEISLRRKSEFIVVNIILPILFLSLINVFVFFLVPESGERVSFCITVLLAIAVYMTIISDTLPKSSSPLPKISYKLMVDMIISSLITIMAIFNLQLYYREDKKSIPNWLKSLYHLIYGTRTFCQICNKIRPKLPQKQTDQVMILSDVNEANSSMNTSDESPFKGPMTERCKVSTGTDVCIVEITWRNVSKMVDCLASVFFLSLSLLNFAVFLLYVHL